MRWLKYGDDEIIICKPKIRFKNSYCFTKNNMKTELEYQKYIIKKIADYLDLSSAHKVEIYFYPKEIARKKIYTDSGGFAAVGKPLSKIHYVARKPRKCNNGLMKTALGIHETAHIITINELGKPKTLFMTEGIVEAIEDLFIQDSNKQKTLIQKMKLIKERGKSFLSVEELAKTSNCKISQILSNDYEEIMDFYCQAGFCCKWLISRLDMKVVKNLFTLNDTELMEELSKHFKLDFPIIEENYSKYILESIKEH